MPCKSRPVVPLAARPDHLPTSINQRFPKQMPPATHVEDPDVILIGSGVMSANLGAMLKRLDPRLSIRTLLCQAIAGLIELDGKPRIEPLQHRPEIGRHHPAANQDDIGIFNVGGGGHLIGSVGKWTVRRWSSRAASGITELLLQAITLTPRKASPLGPNTGQGHPQPEQEHWKMLIVPKPERVMVFDFAV